MKYQASVTIIMIMISTIVLITIVVSIKLDYYCTIAAATTPMGLILMSSFNFHVLVTLKISHQEWHKQEGWGWGVGGLRS